MIASPVPGPRKSNQQKVAESEARRKERGQKKLCIWVPVDREAEVKAIAARWCAEHDAARRERRAERLAAMVAGTGAR